ncbi:tetratricopeptide repeat-containing glycosyltransferase family 2 protein [Paenibacillus cymbidii]|uniref:tetratricopeptide repeat-containing glycosyltransferase family 2 protein n=1 Tax=Paenibacillus cymbidii TaxID=1639034 RepID=UPI0010800059|nr:glycosyltransferase family 2 protein [Paenibacillus cymbidii]
MPSISLCMIVRNEEDHIGRCLDSVAGIADEIVIVDTGSTDETKAVVSRYTDSIHDFVWIDDFAAARNYAFSLATMDYILWLDADDMLEEDDRHKLAALKLTLEPSVDYVNMAYHLAFDEYGNITSSIRRNRLVKRANGYRWIGAVHEYLDVWGNHLQSDIAVTHRALRHDSDRNLRIYERKAARGEQLSPRDLIYFANELMDHRYLNRAIHYYEQFLGTGAGWSEDNIAACGKLADCYHALGDEDAEMEWVLRSFLYGAPRAETCCRLGYYLMQREEYRSASYWYHQALQVGQTTTWALTNRACSTWLPHLQLCVCYDKLGELELAFRHNEEARRYRPDDASIVANKAYLEAALAKREPVDM